MRRGNPYQATSVSLPNPAVNSDAQVYAVVISTRPRRRAGYLIR